MRLISGVARALYSAGLTSALARLSAHARPVYQVLAYHRVNDDGDAFSPAVPVKAFERQMAYVARTYRVMTVEDAVECAARGALSRNALAITFDDGYRDTLTHAAPILARYGLPATVFLATGFIGSAEVPWVDRLAAALKLTRCDTVALPSGLTASLRGDGERLRALERVQRRLKQVHDDACRRTIDALLERLGVTDQQRFKDLMLTWDDVHALRGLGFSIGAHTVNHPILSRVSVARARTEIVGSRTMIESACGCAPRAFAYPNGHAGDYTRATIGLVREAGFTCAVTSSFGVNTPLTSRYTLRRGGPWEHDLAIFAVKLAWYRLARDRRPRPTRS